MALIHKCSKNCCKNNEKLWNCRILKFLPHLLITMVLLNLLGYLGGYRFPLGREKGSSDNNDEYEYYYDYKDSGSKNQPSIKNFTSSTVFDFNHLHRTASELELWPVNQNPATPGVLSSYVTAFPGDQYYFRGWQDFSVDSNRRLLAFSAWLDTRRLELPEAGVVRVIVLSSLGSNISNVRCLYRFSSHTNFHSPDKILSVFAIGSDSDDDSQLKSYVITCPLRGNRKPTEIRLTHLESDSKTEGSIPIQIPATANHKLALTACAIVEYYPDKSPSSSELHEYHKLLEWIVMQRILGVKHITVYINLVNPKHQQMVPLLLIYRKLNMDVLNIRFYSYVFKTHSLSGHKKHLAPLASDCYYSYLNSSKHVMILGIEDFIIPKKESKIVTVLKNLKSKHDSIDHFRFDVNYFYIEFFPRAESTPYSTLLRNIIKVNNTFADPTRKPKSRSVLGTSTCLVAGFEGCAKSLGEFLNSSYGDYYRVEEENTAAHKYTSCVHLKQDCRNLKHSIDETVVKYENILLKKLEANFLKYFNHGL